MEYPVHQETKTYPLPYPLADIPDRSRACLSASGYGSGYDQPGSIASYEAFPMHLATHWAVRPPNLAYY